MIKVVLFDADGVVVRTRPAPFSVRYAQEFGIAPELTSEFYKNEYQLCAVGKSDLRSELPKYFQRWRWTKSVDAMLEYWFSAERDLDQEVLKLIDLLRMRKLKCFLASDNEKHRAKDLWEHLGLKKYFDGSLFSCDMGVKKSNPEFFKKAIDQTSAEASEILYIDDDPKNLQVAKDLGIQGILFESYKKLENDLKGKSE